MKEIDHVLADKRLLGAGLGPLATWQTWLIALKAAFGRPIIDEEREVFHTIAGERDLPKHRVRELWCVAGRRSGKSRMAAATAIFLGLFQKHRLSPVARERPDLGPRGARQIRGAGGRRIGKGRAAVSPMLFWQRG